MGIFKIISKDDLASHSMMRAAVKSEASSSSSPSSYGNTQLAIALAKATATLNARVAAKKIKPSTAAAFRGRIDGLKPLIGKDEDSGLLQAAQIIGSINRAI